MGKLLAYLEKNILSLGIISLLLFIPLYPKFPLFNVPGTYVAIRLEDFWVGLVFAVWLIFEVKQGFITFKAKTPRLILLYFLAGGISLLSALTITKTVSLRLAFFHFLRRIEYMSCFLIAFASVKKKENTKSFIYTLLLSSVGVFIFGIGQKFFNWPVISMMNEEFSKGMALYLAEWTRINSTFAGHYDLAAFAVLVLSLTLGFIIGIRGKTFKILGTILAFLVFYLLLLTASRISFGAYLIVAIFVLVILRKKRWIIPVVSLSLAMMLLSSELGQRYAATFKIDLGFLSRRIASRKEKIAFLPESTVIPTPIPEVSLLEEASKESGGIITEKPSAEKKKSATMAAEFPQLEPVEIATQRSGEIRFKVEWPRALRAFAKNPLSGTGYSSVTLATDNDYLRALAETGILGLGALFLIFLEIGKEFIMFLKKTRSAFEKAVVVGIGGGIIGFLANAAFIDVFEASKVAFIFWILAGIMMGTIKLKEKDTSDGDEATTSAPPR